MYLQRILGKCRWFGLGGDARSFGCHRVAPATREHDSCYEYRYDDGVDDDQCCSYKSRSVENWQTTFFRRLIFDWPLGCLFGYHVDLVWHYRERLTMLRGDGYNNCWLVGSLPVLLMRLRPMAI